MSTREMFSHPYKECFVLLPNQREISQSTPFRVQRPLFNRHGISQSNETFFIRVWKPLPNKRILKTLKGKRKGKAQRGQYLIVVSLGCYKWYHS